jgi:hypothetical protein
VRDPHAIHDGIESGKVEFLPPVIALGYGAHAIICGELLQVLRQVFADIAVFAEDEDVH